MNLADKIGEWLDKGDTNNIDSFKEGALMLLQCNKNNYMYNFLVKNWNSGVQKNKLVYELKKHHRILLSGITLQQVVEMTPKAKEIGKEIESLTEIKECNDKKNEDKKEIVVKAGKREDHERLPKEIQALYIETHNLLLKERSLHEKLKLMEDAKPCDRHEHVTMLIKLDKKRHEDWHRYDSYVINENEQVSEHNLSENANEKNVAIVSCRSYISKNLPKAEILMKDTLKIAAYQHLLAEIQTKYDMAISLGAKFTDKTTEKLKNIGIRI